MTQVDPLEELLANVKTAINTGSFDDLLDALTGKTKAQARPKTEETTSGSRSTEATQPRSAGLQVEFERYLESQSPSGQLTLRTLVEQYERDVEKLGDDRFTRLYVRAALRLQDMTRAERALRRVEYLSNTEYVALGVIAFHSGRTSETLEAFAKAREMAPGDQTPELLVTETLIAYDNGERDVATLIRGVSPVLHKSYDANMFAGAVLFNIGLPAAAAERFDTARRIKPKSEEAQLNYFTAAHAAGMPVYVQIGPALYDLQLAHTLQEIDELLSRKEITPRKNTDVSGLARLIG